MKVMQLVASSCDEIMDLSVRKEASLVSEATRSSSSESSGKKKSLSFSVERLLKSSSEPEETKKGTLISKYWHLKTATFGHFLLTLLF